MFSGIVETLGQIKKIETIGSNINITISCNFIEEVYVDQSIAHDGICLTVVEIDTVQKTYTITAVEETINLTTIKNWRIDQTINLERCLKANARLDGHFVQGHVDTITKCTNIQMLDGSWYFSFHLPSSFKTLVVNKGSIAINGTSLTVILDDENEAFKIAIIPYTFEHTNFNKISIGSFVNVEFDILGKYILRHTQLKSS